MIICYYCHPLFKGCLQFVLTNTIKWSLITKNVNLKGRMLVTTIGEFTIEICNQCQ
jgi:ribosomal protein L31